jgi:hypothetical protein
MRTDTKQTIKLQEPYLAELYAAPKNRPTAEFAETCDAHKYCELSLDVAESILRVFGFSRTQLGFQRKSRNFLEELRSEMMKEILLELGNLQP